MANLIDIFENYLLTDDKDKFIETLAYNREVYGFLRLTHDLKIHGLKVPEKSLKLLLELEEKTQLSKPYQKILMKRNLMELAEETDAERLNQLFHQINENFFNLNFEYKEDNVAQRGNAANQLKTITKKEILNKFPEEDIEEFNPIKMHSKLFLNPDNIHKTLQTWKFSEFKNIDLVKLIENGKEQSFKYVLDNLSHYSHIKDLRSVISAYNKKFFSKLKPNRVGQQPEIKAADFLFEMTNLIKLTTLQLEDLIKIVQDIGLELSESLWKDLVAELFRKKFYTLNEIVEESKAEGITMMNQILDWLHSLNVPCNIDNFVAQITEKILLSEQLLGIYNRDRFIQFVENPSDCRIIGFTEEHLNKLKLEGKGSIVSEYSKAIALQIEGDEGLNTLLKKFLCFFMMEDKGIQNWEIYFKSNYLRTNFEETLIFSGLPFEGLGVTFTDSHLEAIKSRVILSIQNSSNTDFKTSDLVSLTITTKNIDSFTYEVYKIDTLKYYQSEYKLLDESIDLDGLTGISKEAVKLCDADELNPFKKYTTKFDILSIPNKRGIYVVEIIGAQLRTRAIIRKGAITCLHDNATEGTRLWLINENKELCQNKGAGVFVFGKFFEVREDGSVLIPYQTTGGMKETILFDGEFADLESINYHSEFFKFDFSLLYNEEDLHSGQKTKFLLQPRLYCSGELSTLSKIENPKLKISTKTRDDVIDVLIKEELELSYEEALVERYLLPSKLKSVEFTLSGQIYSAVSAKLIPIECSKRINISRGEGQNTLYDIYLDSSNDEYVIRALGRNGEPLTRTEFKVTLQARYSDNSTTSHLTTNDQGNIYLGALRNVERISVGTDLSTSIETRSFDISKYRDTIGIIPHQFEIVEGEDLCLPINPEGRGKCTLHKVSGPKIPRIIESMSECIREDNSGIIIHGLKEGRYIFKYEELAEQIQYIRIDVHRGRRWEKDQRFIFKEKSIIKLETDKKFLVISEKKITEQEISFKIASNSPDNLRVHAIGFNYHPQLPTLEPKLEPLVYYDKNLIFEIPKVSSSYLSQIDLGVELAYTLSRPKDTPMLGVTLPKPTALFKPQFSLNTPAPVSTSEGSSYKFTSGTLTRNPQQLCHRSPTDPAHDYNLTLLNEFLGRTGIIRENLTVDADGIVNISLAGCEDYGCMLVVADDGNSVLVQLIQLQVQQDRLLKDIRLKDSRDGSKLHVYDRSTFGLVKGESKVIENMATSKLCVVENIKTITELITILTNGAQWIQLLQVLLNWSELTIEEKLSKYDSMVSHELNLFCFFRDQKFFIENIASALQAKAEKELVDYFLLGDEENMQNYLSTYTLDQLNNLEKILLIIAFGETHRDKCNGIIENIQLQTNADESLKSSYKKLFDTIINSNSTKSQYLSADGDPNLALSSASLGGSIIISAYRALSLKKYKDTSLKPSTILGPILSNEAFILNEKKEDGQTNESSLTQKKRTAIGSTKEYVETQYIGVQNTKATEFWCDLAKHVLRSPDRPFLSPNFIYCSNFTDLFTALCFIDLPLTKTTTLVEPAGEGVRLTAIDGNMICFSKEFKEKECHRVDLDLSIYQKIYDTAEEYAFLSDGSTKVFKSVDQFAVNKIYGCRLTVTNITDCSQKVSLMYEIPQGAIPVNTLEYLQNKTITINSLETYLEKYYFYFPHAGTYSLFPASITKDGYLISQAATRNSIEVLEKITKETFTSINEILGFGGKADILNFMKTENILNPHLFEFKRIYWLLPDKEFYEQVIKILTKRCIFEPVIWSFSVYHADIETFKEYLKYAIRVMGSQGSIYINNKLIKINQFEFKDYSPMVNPRIHGIKGEKQKFLVDEFKTSYLDLLQYLIEKPEISNRDKVTLCIYLTFQDRIDEAQTIISQVDEQEIERDCMKVNFDYCLAYIDLFKGFPDYKIARDRCGKYLNYPILQWRNRFVEIANQLSEYDGEFGLEKIIEKDLSLMSLEKYLKAKIHNNQIQIISKNLKKISIDYYKINIETIFTAKPFSKQEDSFKDISFIEPTMRSSVETQEGEEQDEFNSLTVCIPEGLVYCNLIIRVYSDDVSSILTYYPSDLQVYVIDKLGQVKVQKDGKPLMKVYVKCMAKNHSGRVYFYKDGYTDLRGTFDYYTLSVGEFTKNHKSFALLISSKEYGVQVFNEIAPPTKESQTSGKAIELLGATWNSLKQAHLEEESEIKETLFNQKSRYYGKKEARK